MEETKQFLFGLVKNYNVNISEAVPSKPLQFQLAKASPVIKNNLNNTISNLIKDGIFELREGHKNTLFLTEQGFNVIYGE